MTFPFAETFTNRPRGAMPFRGLSVAEARAKREPILSFSENEANDEVTIEILDEIGGWGVYASEIIPLLRRLDAEGRTIFIRLNSPGGDVFEGIAIANTIAGMVAKTVVIVDGIAASIASIIAIAADEVRIHSSAAFMVHRPWSFAIGEASDMEKVAGVLKQIENVLIDTYAAAATETPREKHAEMVAEETWLFGAEAIAIGYAHVLVEKPAAKAVITADFAAAAQFKNIPETLRMTDKTDPKKASKETAAPEAKDEGKKDEAAPAAATADAPQASKEAPAERAYTAAEVKEINSLCAKAKMPEKAQEFMDAGIAPAEVRSRLFDAMVAEDATTQTKTANAGPVASAAPEQDDAHRTLAKIAAKQFARINNRK